MKNCNDTIGNQTCDHPACSALPQPTAPPRAPNYQKSGNKNTVTKLALYYKDIGKINAGLLRWTGKTNSWMTVDGMCFRSLVISSSKKKNSRRKKNNVMLNNKRSTLTL